MSLFQIFSILRARLGIVFVTFLITALTALVVSLLMPKQYSAGAAIVLDVKSLDPVAGTILPGMLQPGYLSTQVDIINSGRVATRVVKVLGLEQDTGWKNAWMEADKGKGDFVVWASHALQSKLDAKPSRDSSIIQINYSGTDPAWIAKVANAFAQAYVDVDLDLKIEPARQYATWFEEQARQARAKLEQAQLALSAFQQRSGIVVVDERLDSETNKIAELTTQLTQLQGQITESGSKRASPSAASTEDAMQNRQVNDLKSDLARAESRFQENSGNLGKNHPQTRRAEAEIASLRSQLGRAVAQVSTSFDTSFKIQKQREQQLTAAIEDQKTKVLQLNKQRDEIAVLRRDVESAQRDYDTISQRLSVTRLESRSSQTNVSVLSPATEPLLPSKPRILLNTLAAGVAGLLLGLAFALALELSNRRVRSATDLAIAIDVPVLASIATVKRLAAPSRRPRFLLGSRPALG